MTGLALSEVPNESLETFEEPLILTDLRAIEETTFPFEFFSNIAQAESWRKEINRPTYHIHKWWAQRLGSVFRAIVLGTFSPAGSDLRDLFYERLSLSGMTVFDPFMGSGTTLGETLKLGGNAIGRDINPVAHFLVKNALSEHSREEIHSTFAEIEKDTSTYIRSFYQTVLPSGEKAEVLYYFWVKLVECPSCQKDVELFSSRVFGRHAYKKKHPKAQSVCGNCDGINEIIHDDIETECNHCDHTYNPQVGAARGQYATCPGCDERFSIVKAVRKTDVPPKHKLYGKLVLRACGTKEYHSINKGDLELYQKASDLLEERPCAYPIQGIEPGYNTNQALGYNYRFWHQMFNDRQLLCLSALGDRISQIPNPKMRDLFVCLFSGALEFNNMFASYKGEGTGAVRHMFAHHVLKPERVPLEANVWGTRKSSGSFLTLFNNRIRRALDYAEKPFEQKVSKGSKNKKIYDISEPLGFDIAQSFDEFREGKRVYISCGDSSQTDLSDRSVDAVITDPPFFDNVHYSELADFFHVWQKHILSKAEQATTRSDKEVQNPDVLAFTSRLSDVWVEVHRVLKDEGVLAFTYHHSRSEGWHSVLSSLMRAGFQITAVQPIKAEMSVAMPKQKTKEPIDLDIIIVCRKRETQKIQRWNGDFLSAYFADAEHQVVRFAKDGRRLSRNDVRVILMAQIIKFASIAPDENVAISLLEANEEQIEQRIEELYSLQNFKERKRT